MISAHWLLGQPFLRPVLCIAPVLREVANNGCTSDATTFNQSRAQFTDRHVMRTATVSLLVNEAYFAVLTVRLRLYDHR